MNLEPFRGGCWFDDAGDLRVSCRHGRQPEVRFDYIGFRLVERQVNPAMRGGSWHNEPELESIRGGSWDLLAGYLRVSCRVRSLHVGRLDYFGFRLAERPFESVLRGGSWNDIPEFVRVSNRVRYVPTLRDYLIGFRLKESV